MRICRYGYRCGTISLPTLEDAPTLLSEWLPQRTRWLKGWVVTWLVHMRAPLRLYRDLGPVSFVVLQILCFGLVASALVHPLMVVLGLLLVAILMEGIVLAPWQLALVIVDLSNIALGYLAYFVLGWRATEPGRRRQLRRVAPGIPLYWMLVSLAAWRAVIQLCRQPHRCGLM